MVANQPMKSHLAALLLLLLIVLAFFWPVILIGQWIPHGGGDLVSFLWPMYQFAARSLRAGVVPLWNPHLYSGAPFVADNQSGVFYPINLLTFLLLGEPSYAVVEAMVIFHIWLAGAGMYALARGLRLHPFAALAAGVAFAFSDLFVTHIGNLNLNATAAWLPLILLLTHRALADHTAGFGQQVDRGAAFRRPTGQLVRRAAAAGAVLAVAALAGHGQMLLFLALTIGLYLLYRLISDWRLGWQQALRTLGLMSVIVAVGVGGSALVLFPTWEMAPHTGRSRLSYDEATRYSLPPRALVGVLVPGFYGRGAAGFWGDWDRVEVGYAGVATLILALLGIGRWKQQTGEKGQEAASSHTPSSSLRPFFALLAPLALLLAMGRYTPLYELLYNYAPTFDQVRAPARLILLANLGLAGLAAYGLDRLLTGQGKRSSLWIGIGAIVAGTAWLSVGLSLAQQIPPPDRVAQATLSVVIAAVLLILTGGLVWWAGRSGRARSGAWLILLLLTADLIGLGATVEVDSQDPTRGFRHDDIVAFLESDPGFFRIEAATGMWQPSAALAHGLYDIGGIYNPLGLAPYQAYFWAVGERGAPLHNLLGVKYVLAAKNQPPGDERLAPVYTQNPDIDVYLNTAALPRALLVYQAQVTPDHAAAWTAIHAPGFDPTQTVVLEQGQMTDDEALETGGETLPSQDSHIAFLHYGLNEVELDVRMPKRGYLVLSDVYYPGWQATVDDRPATLLRADYVFRAVALAPGRHVVRMTFTPWTWWAGLAVSIVTWGGLAVVALKSSGIHRKRVSRH